MSVLKCDICGGKLVSYAEGRTACDSCGLEFDRSRLKEMFQEITGTVKIEGTVKVEGLSDINNLIDRAKRFGIQGDFNRAYEYAERVLDLDAKNEDANIIVDIIKNPTISNKVKMPEILNCIKNKDVIKAIKILREGTGGGLKECKDIVDLVKAVAENERQELLIKGMKQIIKFEIISFEEEYNAKKELNK